MFGAPVATLGPAGGPAYGAAVMAAVGAGTFGSIPEATDSWVSPKDRTDLDPERARVYDELYGAYRQLYPSLKDRFTDSAGLMDRLSG